MRLKGNPEKWLAALQGQDEAAWNEATMMMGSLNPAHRISPAPFHQALASPDEDVVFWSIVALANLGRKSRSAIPELMSLTKHRRFGIRQMALIALADIAPSNQTVKRTIFGSFSDRSPWVRSEALRAVINLRNLSRRDFQRVQKMLADGSRDVAYNAEITIRNIRYRKRIRNGAA